MADNVLHDMDGNEWVVDNITYNRVLLKTCVQLLEISVGCLIREQLEYSKQFLEAAKLSLEKLGIVV